MNGRIYDPLIGRFLSADIVVQFPGDLQSYNRYSYVQNNPLTYNDPSGHFIPLVIAGAVWLSAGEVAVVGTAVVGATALSTEKGREAYSDFTNAAAGRLEYAASNGKGWLENAWNQITGRSQSAQSANATAIPVPGNVSTTGTGNDQGKKAEEKSKEEAGKTGGATPATKPVSDAAPVPNSSESAKPVTGNSGSDSAKPAQETKAKDGDGSSTTSAKKKDEPASEETAKKMAKQIEKDLGKDARRDFHDAKEGRDDRTLEQLKQDAQDLYDEHNEKIPKWMSP